MHFKKSGFFFALVFFSSCGRYDPFDIHVSSNVDGSAVIQTSMSDAELLNYGFNVIYRFQSVPNLIAVTSNNLSDQDLGNFYASNKSIYSIIESNKKIRPDYANQQKNTEISNCNSSYCEANFTGAMELIAKNGFNLQPVSVAVVDSGIVPSTFSISNHISNIVNLTKNSNPFDWADHGTMIASVLSGYIDEKNQLINDIYAPNVKLNSVKINLLGDKDNTHDKPYGSMQLAVAIDQAVAMGSKIVTLSLTYLTPPDIFVQLAEKTVISNAIKNGVLFVVAAGNENENLDKTTYYPAGYNLNNVITVSSHTAALTKAVSSNYGAATDVSAQGAFIYVNDKLGQQTVAGGTSFAVPIVVAALCLYYGIKPDSSLNQTLSDLFSSTQKNYHQTNVLISRYGRLDAKSFVEKLMTSQ